jgi:hypothetical protein
MLMTLGTENAEFANSIYLGTHASSYQDYTNTHVQRKDMLGASVDLPELPDEAF